MNRFRRIITEAWSFTQNNKKLIIWYAIIPALFTTLVGMMYLTYQFFAFRSSPLFEDWDQGFALVLLRTVLDIVRDNFIGWLPVIIIAIVIGLIYLVIPSICEGAIIQLIARKRNKQDVRTRDGLKYGLLSFLPIFEFSWLKRSFSFISLLTTIGFIWRNLGTDALKAFSPVLFLIFVVGVILTLLFTFTEFFIVIDGRRVIQSIGKSCELVIRNLEATILLSILMLIISVRILLQILFVLLIPAVIVFSIYFLASTTLPIVALTIGGIIGLIMLYIASYISGTIHVFADAVWIFAFLDLTAEEELSAREKMGEEA